MPDGSTLSASETVEATGYDVAVLAKLPINDKFEIFARLGSFSWEATSKSEFTFFVPDEVNMRESEKESIDGTDKSLGFGGRVNLNDKLGISLEYTRYEIEDIDTDFLSLGASYAF